MIDRRPKSIEKRTTLGHWEADTVVGKRKTITKKCIFTCVDRKSGFLVARILENAQAKHLATTAIETFKDFPKYKLKTMTVDNGREFARHYDIERELQMNVYFAHPYSSWQRGTNENINGLLRQFLPKGTDFEFLTEKELQKYVALINSRPRKRLNFLSPYQVFFNKS